jgi:hypothetical protein
MPIHMKEIKKCRSILSKLFSGCLIVVVLFSCTNEDDSKSGKEIVLPLTPGGYLIQGEAVTNVSSATMQLAMDAAGYPEFKSYVKYSIKLYKISYNTTYKGQPIVASGLISYPAGINEPIPSMIVGNGLTFADRDAPTSFKLPDNFTGFEFIAAMGYLTLIPDMIGFGESSEITFPIHNYQYSAQTMIDFVFAVDEFIEAKGLSVNNRKYLTGYSQGAYIALSTLKMIQEKPVPEIKIEATAVGAGGYNLVNLLNYAIDNNTYSAPCHLILLFTSYNEIYGWGRPMTDFFQEPYASRIPTLLNGQYDRLQINDQLAYSFDSLLNPVFLNNLKNENEPALISALAENCIDDWAPLGKVNLIHSINDDRIPFKDSQDTYNKMILNGADSVYLTQVETVGHINAALDFIQQAFAWFNEIELKKKAGE